MKISVLISAPQPVPALATALAGVATQLHGDWDLIVATPEDTAIDAALRDFPPAQGRVRHERTDPASDEAAVRDHLLQLATGEAIAFLEPQDLWLPRHLASAVPLLTGGVDVAVSNVRLHDTRTDRIVSELSMPAMLGSAPSRALFVRDPIPSVSCVVVRRSVAVACGGFDARLRTMAGRDFWLRCALQGARFGLTQRATCHCTRSRPPSDRGLPQAEQAVLFFEKHRDISAVPAALRRRLLAGALVAQGRLLRPIDAARAARCFMRAWSLQPVHVQTLGQYALTEWRGSQGAEPRDES